MKSVHDILRDKGADVWMIDSNASVFDALSLMAEKSIGAVVVTDEDRPIGIVSERDYARKVVLEGRESKRTPVKEIMTADPICVRLGHTIDECMALMTAKRIRHLPVIEDGRLAGLVSIGDVVKATIDEQEFVIQQLESYISGH